MYYICNECGEVFETPVYRKDRSGLKTIYCPNCDSSDDIEVFDENETEFYDYEIIEDDEELI